MITGGDISCLALVGSRRFSATSPAGIRAGASAPFLAGKGPRRDHGGLVSQTEVELVRDMT